MGTEPGSHFTLVEVTELAGGFQPAQRLDAESFRLGVGQQGITKASSALQPQPVLLNCACGQRLQVSEAERRQGGEQVTGVGGHQVSRVALLQHVERRRYLLGALHGPVNQRGLASANDRAQPQHRIHFLVTGDDFLRRQLGHARQGLGAGADRRQGEHGAMMLVVAERPGA
ncbi:hypothetical protein D3C76_947960 [compost metagenome]